MDVERRKEYVGWRCEGEHTIVWCVGKRNGYAWLLCFAWW